MLVLCPLGPLPILYCWYDSIYPPPGIVRLEAPTVHDNGSVMLSLPAIIFIISILVFVPVLIFTTIFHTLILHIWMEISL